MNRNKDIRASPDIPSYILSHYLDDHNLIYLIKSKIGINKLGTYNLGDEHKIIRIYPSSRFVLLKTINTKYTSPATFTLLKITYDNFKFVYNKTHAKPVLNVAVTEDYFVYLRTRDTLVVWDLADYGYEYILDMNITGHCAELEIDEDNNLLASIDEEAKSGVKHGATFIDISDRHKPRKLWSFYRGKIYRKGRVFSYFRKRTNTIVLCDIFTKIEIEYYLPGISSSSYVIIRHVVITEKYVIVIFFKDVAIIDRKDIAIFNRKTTDAVYSCELGWNESNYYCPIYVSVTPDEKHLLIFSRVEKIEYLLKVWDLKDFKCTEYKSKFEHSLVVECAVDNRNFYILADGTNTNWGLVRTVLWADQMSPEGANASCIYILDIKKGMIAYTVSRNIIFNMAIYKDIMLFNEGGLISLYRL